MEDFKFPTKSLFKRKLDVSHPDVTIQEGSHDAELLSGDHGPGKAPPESPKDSSMTTYLAVTVNIKPNKLINRRRWKLYDNTKQMAILTRLESAFRNVTPSVILKKLNFEKCPSNGNIHFHAMYEAPLIYMSTIYNYWDEKIDGNDLETKVPWRHVIVKNVFDKKGWIDYISKYENL